MSFEIGKGKNGRNSTTKMKKKKKTETVLICAAFVGSAGAVGILFFLLFGFEERIEEEPHHIRQSLIEREVSETNEIVDDKFNENVDDRVSYPTEDPVSEFVAEYFSLPYGEQLNHNIFGLALEDVYRGVYPSLSATVFDREMNPVKWIKIEKASALQDERLKEAGWRFVKYTTDSGIGWQMVKEVEGKRKIHWAAGDFEPYEEYILPPSRNDLSPWSFWGDSVSAMWDAYEARFADKEYVKNEFESPPTADEIELFPETLKGKVGFLRCYFVEPDNSRISGLPHVTLEANGLISKINLTEKDKWLGITFGTVKFDEQKNRESEVLYSGRLFVRKNSDTRKAKAWLSLPKHTVLSAHGQFIALRNRGGSLGFVASDVAYFDPIEVQWKSLTDTSDPTD